MTKGDSITVAEQLASQTAPGSSENPHLSVADPPSTRKRRSRSGATVSPKRPRRDASHRSIGAIADLSDTEGSRVTQSFIPELNGLQDVTIPRIENKEGWLDDRAIHAVLMVFRIAVGCDQLYFLDSIAKRPESSFRPAKLNFLPTFVVNHFLFAVIDNTENRVIIYDSKESQAHREAATTKITAFYKAIGRSCAPLIRYALPSRQENSYDCGVIVAISMVLLLGGQHAPLGQIHGVFCRRFLCVLLLPLTDQEVKAVESRTCDPEVSTQWFSKTSLSWGLDKHEPQLETSSQELDSMADNIFHQFEELNPEPEALLAAVDNIIKQTEKNTENDGGCMKKKREAILRLTACQSWLQKLVLEKQRARRIREAIKKAMVDVKLEPMNGTNGDEDGSAT